MYFFRHVCVGVSTTQVSELRNRFDPAARERAAGGKVAPRPADMGKPSNTVTQITSIFEHKARSDRRKVRGRPWFTSLAVSRRMRVTLSVPLAHSLRRFYCHTVVKQERGESADMPCAMSSRWPCSRCRVQASQPRLKFLRLASTHRPKIPYATVSVPPLTCEVGCSLTQVLSPRRGQAQR